ncbi:MAG: MFS transporter [Woeseia sp.]
MPEAPRQPKALFSAMLPIERRSVALVSLISTCRMFGLFALLPVLALFAGDLRGATPMLIGVAVGGYGLTQALLQIPFGAASDRFGRMPVILFGLAMFTGGSIIAAESLTIWGVIAGRLLQGAGAVSATLAALLADSTRPEVRTRSMAIFGIGIGASFLLALIVGPMIAASAGVRALFWVSALLGVAGAMLVFALPRAPARVLRETSVPWQRSWKLSLLQLDLYIFLLHVLLTASFVALPFLLRNRLGLPLTDHWPIYVGALVLSLAGTLPLIVADDRRGRASTIGIAVALLFAGELVLVFAGDSTPAVVAALSLFFAGFNFLEAGLPARLSLLADSELRGASLGLFASCQFLGAFAGGLLGGHFLKGGEPATVFLVCAVLAAGWLALLGIAPKAAKAGEST